MGFDEWTILRASQINRTAPTITGTAAKAANIYHDIAAEILNADSQWLLQPKPVSSNAATKKIRRSEIFRFSSASAPNLLDARDHVEETVQKNGAEALRRVKSSRWLHSSIGTTCENSWIYDGQMKIKLTSQNAHDINLTVRAPKVRKADDPILSYVITAGVRC
jgi:hypothetical protein